MSDSLPSSPSSAQSSSSSQSFSQWTLNERTIQDFLDTLTGPVYQRIEDQTHYNPLNLHLAELNIRTWCSSPVIIPTLIRLVAKMWVSSATGTFPSLHELTVYFQERACLCIRGYEEWRQLEIIEYFLSCHGRLPACIETLAFFQFNPEGGHHPTPEQLRMIVSTIEEMAAPVDPSQPTLHLEDLASSIMAEEGRDCSLCCEGLLPGHEVYVLTPCGHAFHAQAKECLGTCTIRTWLEKNRTCPVCREIVVLKA